ncbi:peptidoglycan D,D-transpeptidase FtsI family protein [Hippea sp. KM1]|uniref:peptidoglycan D,D-transpeptidase FtsI family protein n=1 Tax=Hippea sp. KM1 TaxID=944481 RepID=UPI00046D545A|nr:penicillin-binding protein 2 [Hippea sp. KM1]
MNRVRFSFVVSLIFASFLIVVIKSFYIQLIKGKAYKEEYVKKLVKTITVSGRRGLIYDEKGRPLALNYPVFDLFVDPYYLFQLRKVYKTDEYYRQREELFVEDLSNILHISKNRLWSLINSNRSRRYVVIKKNLSLDDYNRIRNDDNFIRAFGFIKRFRRFYPDGEFSAHVVGFCYSNNRGAEGLERYYDKYLSGLSIKEDIAYDIYKRRTAANPIDGVNLKISLNRDIQDFVHEQLRNTVLKHEADKGVVVVMDPYTGEVVAMDSYPFYDNNHFWHYSYVYVKNRAVSDAFEPGSVFKLLTMAAALDSGIFKGNERIYCQNGRWRLHGKVIHDVHRFKMLRFRDVFVYSSNIGSAKIALKLGKKVFYSYLNRFGLGRKTGIDTISETKGIVKDIFNVGDVDLANMAFGQGISVSEIQLSVMYSVIANGGYWVRPHFMVKTFKDNSTQGYTVFKKRILKPSTVEKIKGILRDVVVYGTGKNAALDDYAVAGKTGTAQIAKHGKYQKQYVASFVGFAPFSHPKFVVAVSIFNPKKGGFYGGEVAAPLFARVMEFVLHYYGVMPDKD